MLPLWKCQQMTFLSHGDQGYRGFYTLLQLPKRKPLNVAPSRLYLFYCSRIPELGSDGILLILLTETNALHPTYLLPYTPYCRSGEYVETTDMYR